jgi:thioredoxin-like negative regulator of GroEL
MKVDMSAKAIDAGLRLASFLSNLWRLKGMPVRYMDMTNLQYEEYEDFIKSKPITVIHFRADWNGIDLEQRENLSRVDPNYACDVRFGAVDIDDPKFRDLARALKILNIPALAYYQDGKHLETVIGLCSKDGIEGKLNQLVKQESPYRNEPNNK